MRKWIRLLLLLFVIQIYKGGKWRDASVHTRLSDAQTQRERYIGQGIPATDIRIVEKSTFAPPPSPNQ